MKNLIILLVVIFILPSIANGEAKKHAFTSCHYVKSSDFVVDNTPVKVVVYDCVSNDNNKAARFITVDKALVINEYAAQRAALSVDAASEFFATIDGIYFFNSPVE
ncbi:MAG: hypothetical protein HZB79_09080 [Deltaproteobacteria bacterium]|nr:hypothetical protein [Deltaproteobacteria bacterium]